MAPASSTDLTATMEAMLLASFPALEADQRDGLWVGHSHGVTGRSNSAVVLGDVRDVPATIGWAVDWLSRRGVDPLFRLSPLASDAVVAALPAESFNTTSAYHVDLRRVSAAEANPRVELASTRPAEWISEGTPEREAEVAALMHNVDGDVAWAIIRDEGRPVAAGRGVVVGQWLCIQEMYTDPAARGRGFANAILAQLHQWATSRGANDAFLNVVATNDAALSVYRAHGYEHVYDYRYVTVS